MHEELLRLVLDYEMLRRFFANHPEGLVLFDPEGTCLLTNRALANMLGHSAEEAARTSSDSHTSVSQSLKLADGTAWDSIRAGDDVVNRRMELSNKKGENVSVLINGTIVGHGADGARLALASVTNITEYKKKEDELLNKEKQSATLIEEMEKQLKENADELEIWKNELHQCYRSIESMNYAVKLLIKRIRDQERDLNERVAQNFIMTIQPILDQLKTGDLPEPYYHLIETLDFNVKHITTLFGVKLAGNKARLSPREMEICQMIRAGKDSRDIAKALGLTYHTVIVHRKNIRKKLGLNQKRQNLANFLKRHFEAGSVYPNQS
jgi:PAS domain S-box-containing protein